MSHHPTHMASSRVGAPMSHQHTHMSHHPTHMSHHPTHMPHHPTHMASSRVGAPESCSMLLLSSTSQGTTACLGCRVYIECFLTIECVLLSSGCI